MSEKLERLVKQINPSDRDEPGLTRERCLFELDAFARIAENAYWRSLAEVPRRFLDAELIEEACRLNFQNLYVIEREDWTVELCVAAIQGKDPDPSRWSFEKWHWMSEELRTAVLCELNRLGKDTFTGVGPITFERHMSNLEMEKIRQEFNEEMEREYEAGAFKF